MSFQEQLAEVIESFDSGAHDETRLLLESHTAQEKANMLTTTPPHLRHVLWELLGEETAYQALGYLHDDVRADLLESMQAEELIAALEEIDGLLATLRAGDMQDTLTMQALFAPTGPVQEVSLSGGWGNRFLELAERFDEVMGK